MASFEVTTEAEDSKRENGGFARAEIDERSRDLEKETGSEIYP